MKYKEVSHIPIEEIERQQWKHREHLLQPRFSDGTINLEFVKKYGTSRYFVSDEDIKFLAKKGMTQILNDPKFRKQVNNPNQKL